MNHYLYLDSPIGGLQITTSDEQLTALSFCDGPQQPDRPDRLAVEVRRQLQAYFSRERRNFALPLAPRGTAFQQKVWAALQTIPFGSTCSYLQLSRQLGDEKAIRAVAGANGRNPIAIVIPCHRVIGSDGQLVGYSGGLWRKKWLLSLEDVLLQQELPF